MPTDHILALLIAERDKLTAAIEALSGPTKRRGRPPASAKVETESDAPVAKKEARKKRTYTPEQRAAQSEKIRAYWAKRKRAAKKAG